MKKRTLIFALFVLILPAVLVACGGGFDEGKFEDALETAFEDGDFGDFNDMVCEADQIDLDEESSGDVSVDCSVDDDNVDCDVDLDGQTLTLSADIDDDKACNITVGDGTQTLRLQDLMNFPSDANQPDVEDTDDSDSTDGDVATPTAEDAGTATPEG